MQLGEDKWEREEVAEDVVGDLKVSGANDEVERAIILSQGTVAAVEGLALKFNDGPSCSLFKEGTNIMNGSIWMLRPQRRLWKQ